MGRCVWWAGNANVHETSKRIRSVGDSFSDSARFHFGSSVVPVCRENSRDETLGLAIRVLALSPNWHNSRKRRYHRTYCLHNHSRILHLGYASGDNCARIDVRISTSALGAMVSSHVNGRFARSYCVRCPGLPAESLKGSSDPLRRPHSSRGAKMGSFQCLN